MDITTVFETVISGSNPDGCIYNLHVGHVAELVYAYVSEAYPARGEGSTPSVPTNEQDLFFPLHM